MTDMDDDALLDALGVDIAPLKAVSHTPREERIIAGFEDILRFYETHGRAPRHGEGGDIFERLYAVRLDQLRKLPEAQALLAGLDAPGLLATSQAATAIRIDMLDEDALLAELGEGAAVAESGDITVLRHVRSSAQRQAAQEVAERVLCTDFEAFKFMFTEAEAGLKTGTWISKPFIKNASIQVGDFFLLGGQIAYVAAMAKGGTTKDGRDNPRLRVIFDNQTESNLLLRSLSRSLYSDGDTPVGSRLIRKDDGPLFAPASAAMPALTPVFGSAAQEDDLASGTIYVLRSLSNHAFVAQHRELIHKIGVTGGKVEDRIAGADKDATYLLADVEVVATYKLHNLNRTKLEAIFHRLFGAAQLEVEIEDRFGNPVRPREWFLVPLHVIDEAVQRIQDGSITEFVYNPETVSFLKK